MFDTDTKARQAGQRAYEIQKAAGATEKQARGIADMEEASQRWVMDRWIEQNVGLD